MATSREVCRRAGISYRQLDHWVGQGLVAAHEGANPGTGHDRAFAAVQMQRVVHAAKLMRAVNCPPKTAFALLDRFEAVALPEDDGPDFDGRGVTLGFTDVRLRLQFDGGYLVALRRERARAQAQQARSAAAPGLVPAP